MNMVSGKVFLFEFDKVGYDSPDNSTHDYFTVLHVLEDTQLIMVLCIVTLWFKNET